jgi:hypothetical protein
VDQLFQVFSECVLCRHLASREKEALFTRVRIRDFAASETIFVTGSPADSMMIVLRGSTTSSSIPMCEVSSGSRPAVPTTLSARRKYPR